MSVHDPHPGDWVTLKSEQRKKAKAPWQVLAVEDDRVLIAPLRGLDPDTDRQTVLRSSEVVVADTCERAGDRPPDVFLDVMIQLADMQDRRAQELRTSRVETLSDINLDSPVGRGVACLIVGVAAWETLVKVNGWRRERGPAAGVRIRAAYERAKEQEARL